MPFTQSIENHPLMKLQNHLQSLHDKEVSLVKGAVGTLERFAAKEDFMSKARDFVNGMDSDGKRIAFYMARIQACRQLLKIIGEGLACGRTLDDLDDAVQLIAIRETYERMGGYEKATMGTDLPGSKPFKHCENAGRLSIMRLVFCSIITE